MADPEDVWHVAEEHRRNLDSKLRSSLGIFYTPPAVADRLIADLESAGARFDGSQRFCDPACGGGAFLLPVARRIGRHLAGAGGGPDDLAACLVGMDLDPGGLAITRAALDALALELFRRTPEWDLRQANTLRLAVSRELPTADAVIGNPPFGRVRLTPKERESFRESLRGHANLYGLFLDVALRISSGLVGYVMPTSWLAGDYFGALRALLCRNRPLRRLRFVGPRAGVFDGVLQEMCLAVFDGDRDGAEVFDDLDSGEPRTVRVSGSEPWFIARKRGDVDLVAAAARHGNRLADYGYTAHTGPLVWNRHRAQLRERPGRGTAPIVWSDAVRADVVVDAKTTRRANKHLALEGMRHLELVETAVLVKRTTAKEQRRRIIAAPLLSLPAVVENHLNVLTADGVVPKVTVEELAALLNSEPVDRLFRCLSGTVAVSASELEALPLPPPDALGGLLEAEDRDAAVLRAYGAD